MNNLLKTIFLSFIFFKINDARMDDDEVATLVTSVQTFYLSRSIYIVYDQKLYGFAREKRLMDTIRRYSNQWAMSQAITYDELNQTSQQRGNILHSLLIKNTMNLELAINTTKNFDMSVHPWLLLITGKTNLDCDNPGRELFSLKMDTKMLALCDRNRFLKRYHRVLDNQTEVNDFAEWTLEKKLKFMDPKSLVKVRTDMKGVTLSLAKREDKIEEANEHLAKFLSNLIDELSVLGNFKTKVTIRETREGLYDEDTRKWSGLMRIIHEKKADIGMVLLTISNSRLNAVDFATPFARARNYLFARSQEAKKVHWTAYFQAFDVCSWATIGLSILLVSLVLSFVTRENEGNLIQTFHGHLIKVWGIYCQQGLADPPSNTTTQIIYFSVLLSSLVLNAIYSAIITSYITLLSSNLPFSTYEEFKLDTTYKVTILKDSRDQDLILRSDPYLRPLASRLRKACKLAEDPYEGYLQACEPNTVFYSDNVDFDGVKNKLCQLDRVDMKREEHMSFILNKNSPYTRTLSYFITRLREHGILMRLKNQYFFKFTELPDNRPNVMTIQETEPIFAVWFIGVVITLVVWFLELLKFHVSNYFHPSSV